MACANCLYGCSLDVAAMSFAIGSMCPAQGNDIRPKPYVCVFFRPLGDFQNKNDAAKSCAGCKNERMSSRRAISLQNGVGHSWHQSRGTRGIRVTFLSVSVVLGCRSRLQPIAVYSQHASAVVGCFDQQATRLNSSGGYDAA